MITNSLLLRYFQPDSDNGVRHFDGDDVVLNAETASAFHAQNANSKRMAAAYNSRRIIAEYDEKTGKLVEPKEVA